LNCIDEVDISLDFGDAERHNKYRGNKNAFDWAINTLKFCKMHGIVTTIVTLGIDQTLCIENMSKIFSIAQTYDTKVRINLYRPVNKKININPASLSSILTFFDWVSEKHKVLSISDPLFSSLLCAGATNSDPSGRCSLRITHDGNIYPSTYLLYDEFLVGNIQKFDMSKDLQKNTGIKNLVEAPIPNKCLACEYVKSCKGGVLDRRYIWYGDLKERDPYCFVESKERLRDFKQEKTGFISVHDGYLPTLFFEP